MKASDPNNVTAMIPSVRQTDRGGCRSQAKNLVTIQRIRGRRRDPVRPSQ
jgi:hypothetical protein